MSVEMKITLRHARRYAPRLREDRATLVPRRGPHVVVPTAARALRVVIEIIRFTNRFHRNTAGAANAVVRPKRRRSPRCNQSCVCSHDSEHRRTARSRTRGPLLDRCRGKGPPASNSEGARCVQGFFYQHWCGAATRTNFQLSRHWFAPRMSGSPQSRPNSRAPTSIRATSTVRPAALRLPDSPRPRGRSSLGVLPTTIETAAPVAHRGSLRSTLTEWSFRMDSPSMSIALSERSLKVDQQFGDVCDARALFLQSLDRKRKRRMKSPFTIESIDDRYCRSPRGVMPSRPAQLALFLNRSEDCRSTIPRSYVNYSYRILETFVPRCDNDSRCRRFHRITSRATFQPTRTGDP